MRTYSFQHFIIEGEVPASERVKLAFPVYLVVDQERTKGWGQWLIFLV